MPRWRPNAPERLQAAAFELFEERGFERTTVAEVAARAGLTPRTFFNHFSDKAEVLFSLSGDFEREVVDQIGACPDDLPPLEAAVRGLQAAAKKTFAGRRSEATRRQEIVDANLELRERDLAKRAALTAAIAGALRARGGDPESAQLIAGAAMLVQQAAMAGWTRADQTDSIAELHQTSLQELRASINR